MKHRLAKICPLLPFALILTLASLPASVQPALRYIDQTPQCGEDITPIEHDERTGLSRETYALKGGFWDIWNCVKEKENAEKINGGITQ